MKQRISSAVLILAVAGVLVLGERVAQAENPPVQRGTLRPEVQGGDGGLGNPLGKVLENYRGILEKLDLTAQQRDDIKSVFEESAQRFRQIAPGLRDVTPQQRREKVMDLLKNLNEGIEVKLNEDQTTKFKTAIQAQFGDRQEAGKKSASATRPANVAVGTLGGGRVLQGLKSAVESLDLSVDQKDKIEQIFKDAKDTMPKGEPGSPEFRNALQDLRGKLAGVLTSAQQEAFQEKMRNLRERLGGEAPARREKTGDKAANTGESEMMKDGEAGNGKTTVKSGEPSGLAIGTQAPELAAKRLDGIAAKLSTFKGRPIVLIFASYSVPTFRDKAAQINSLVKDYRGRVEVVVVYTAEAHPVDGWDVGRNKDDKVRIPQHKTETDRIMAARDAKTALKLDCTMIVDDMSNGTSAAYGSGPNSAYVLTHDGKVAVSQPWFESWSLRSGIDEVFKPATRPASE